MSIETQLTDLTNTLNELDTAIEKAFVAIDEKGYTTATANRNAKFLDSAINALDTSGYNYTSVSNTTTQSDGTVVKGKTATFVSK